MYEKRLRLKIPSDDNAEREATTKTLTTYSVIELTRTSIESNRFDDIFLPHHSGRLDDRPFIPAASQRPSRRQIIPTCRTTEAETTIPFKDKDDDSVQLWLGKARLPPNQPRAVEKHHQCITQVKVLFPVPCN